MPSWLRRFLFRLNLRRHLALALAVGFVLRSLSAYFVYGPQALDDYKHGVWPAYQFFAGLPLDLPEYRSPLLVWFLSVFIEISSWLGGVSALTQVRAIYFGLGLTSLLAVYGTYLLVRNYPSRIYAPLAVYLSAAFPLMPFLSTRAFGEAVAAGFVALAFGLLESSRIEPSPRSRNWILGFAVLGLATLFRFHVGLMYVAYLGVLLKLSERRGLLAGIGVGFLILGAAALVDVLAGRAPLATLAVYLLENEGGGAKYGVNPWYNPLLFVLGVSLAPFSFVLWRHARLLWLKLWPVLVPAAVFLLAHMAVAHKEERFLYPILHIELWALAFLWSASALDKWARRLFSYIFFGVSALALPIVCFVNTQAGEIEPPALIEHRFRQVLFMDYESLFGRSRFQFYFLRPPSALEKIDVDGMVAHAVDDGFSRHPGVRAVAFLTSDPVGYDRMRMIEGISTIEGECGPITRSGSLMDRFIYAMNPKHNQRRRPTWYMVCERRLPPVAAERSE